MVPAQKTAIAAGGDARGFDGIPYRSHGIDSHPAYIGLLGENLLFNLSADRLHLASVLLSLRLLFYY